MFTLFWVSRGLGLPGEEDRGEDYFPFLFSSAELPGMQDGAGRKKTESKEPGQYRKGPGADLTPSLKVNERKGCIRDQIKKKESKPNSNN